MPCLSEFQYANMQVPFLDFHIYPLWRPIVIFHLWLGYITLGIGYNSQILPFWESERVLTTNLEISTNKENMYI